MFGAKMIFGGDFFKNDNQKLLNGKSAGDFGLIDWLNNTYTINDRDLNAIGETLAYDRLGVHNWGSRMLYLNTISPDWFNRMIIFVAKMHADGTFNAHSLSESGRLVYDPSKDERISYFWENKPKRPGDPEPNNTKYIE